MKSPLVEVAAKGRWDEARAAKWYEGVTWPVGANFLPSSAVNQLEMWQVETFDAEELDRELGWLAGLGMNTMRVFLHDLLWQQDAKGFLARIEQFLEISDKHGMRMMLVFFDSCWHPYPALGPQTGFKPHVHNCFWAQSPGIKTVLDPAAFVQLEDYVTGVVSHFKNDPRVLVWDVWNEPNNPSTTSFPVDELTAEQKDEIVAPLLAETFKWARAGQPTQPLTSGVWIGDYSSDEVLTTLMKVQLFASDVISFHSYGKLDSATSAVEALKRFKRPQFCTEYMARGTGSTFEAILPYFKQEKVAAYNWGAVAGRSQTNYPWASWEEKFTEEPKLWHHDILRRDGSAYDPNETALIKSLTGK